MKFLSCIGGFFGPRYCDTSWNHGGLFMSVVLKTNFSQVLSTSKPTANGGESGGRGEVIGK